MALALRASLFQRRRHRNLSKVVDLFEFRVSEGTLNTSLRMDSRCSGPRQIGSSGWLFFYQDSD